MTAFIPYQKPTQMEPLLPTVSSSILSDLAVDVIQKSSSLGSLVHPKTRLAIVELVRSMNSYYSNLIEGHNTLPTDIEKALSREYSADPAKRALQMESTAHIEVQKLIEALLHDDPSLNICQGEFLCRVHKEFYDRLPDEFREVRTKDGEKVKTVYPGQFRDDDVEVGAHVPPLAKALPDFMTRFSSTYGKVTLSKIDRVVCAAASHHRLAWIHPFLDGNGRVTRLFTHAFFIKAHIDGHGMWTVSRGLARNRDAYLAKLAGADRPRQGDLDGRGNLSNKGLLDFCAFFLSTALDQISFMSDLLAFDDLQKRIDGYVQRQVTLGKLHPTSSYLLQEAFLRGEIQRGEAARITGLSTRGAHDIFKKLLKNGLLVSRSERGPLRLAFPAKAVGYYFPRLYPEGVEIQLEEDS